MKIGILTYHRSDNYGALLQAIALRYVLNELGHDTYFIDYWPEYHKDMYRIYNHAHLRSLSFLSKVKYCISMTLRMSKIKKNHKAFERFKKIYVYPYLIGIDKPVDCVVYGSDQIWRKQPGLGNNQLNPVYFGDNNIKTSKHWSYAASMGKISLTEEDKANIKNWLSKFDKVSVRESDLKDTIDECGVPNVKQVLDPTLLLSRKKWEELLSIELVNGEKPYVLFYDLLPNSFDTEEISKFAKANNCDLKIIKGALIGKHVQPNEYPYADPKQMVELIANAECVFTSSFHGLVFALIFQKDVYCAFSKNSVRAKSLLEKLGIGERLLDPMSTVPSLDMIKYSQINKTFQKLILASIDFLRN